MDITTCRSGTLDSHFRLCCLLFLNTASSTYTIGGQLFIIKCYFNFSRTLPVSGNIPIGIMLLIWTELLLIPIVLVIQSLDLRFHLPDLQKDNTKTFSTFVIINYLQIISQLFVNFSLFGATYLRFVILLTAYNGFLVGKLLSSTITILNFLI